MRLKDESNRQAAAIRLLVQFFAFVQCFHSAPQLPFDPVNCDQYFEAGSRILTTQQGSTMKRMS